jgi:hypothetical protein
MAGRPTPLSCIIPQSSATILATLRQQQQWLERVRRRLPQVLAQHCIACTVSGAKMSIYTDSPAWAFQLRFAAPKLLKELQREGAAVTAIDIRIATPPPAAPPQVPSRLPSPLVAELIKNYAEPGSDDPLSAALRRLGGTLEKRLRLCGELGSAEPHDEE